MTDYASNMWRLVKGEEEDPFSIIQDSFFLCFVVNIISINIDFTNELRQHIVVFLAALLAAFQNVLGFLVSDEKDVHKKQTLKTIVGWQFPFSVYGSIKQDSQPPAGQTEFQTPYSP